MGKFRRRLQGLLCCGQRDDNEDVEASHPSSAHPSQTAFTSEKIHPKNSTESSEQPPEPELTPFQIQARQIAQMPVAGMRRATGAGGISSYMTTYQSVRPASEKTAPRTMPGQSTIASNDSTMIGFEGHSAHDKDKEEEERRRRSATVSATPTAVNTGSTWQGKPNGTTYDRREELTEEDEDAWARMAM